MSRSFSSKKRQNTVFNYIDGDNDNIGVGVVKNCYRINKKNWLFNSDLRYLDIGSGQLKLAGINKNKELIKRSM